MKKATYSEPDFLINSLPVPAEGCRELLRHIEINAPAPDIFVWLSQLRIAPYSYDFIDNRFRKSPDFIIEDLPPLKVNSHFLLAFHIYDFGENSFIASRFCQPINFPVNLYMNDLFCEYRITEQEGKSHLWCKLKGYFNTDIYSKGFFILFSGINKIMMTRQLKKIKRLSEHLKEGKIEKKKFTFNNYFPKSGIDWWIFCRRHNCKGLIS